MIVGGCHWAADFWEGSKPEEDRGLVINNRCLIKINVKVSFGLQRAVRRYEPWSSTADLKAEHDTIRQR